MWPRSRKRFHQAETATDSPEAPVEEQAGIIVEEPALAADAAEPVVKDDASRQIEQTGVEADAEPNIETASAPELAADAAVLHEGAAAELETAVPEIGPEPVDLVLIEVWRPSRFERSEGQRPNRQKRGRDGKADSKTDGKSEGWQYGRRKAGPPALGSRSQQACAGTKARCRAPCALDTRHECARREATGQSAGKRQASSQARWRSSPGRA